MLACSNHVYLCPHIGMELHDIFHALREGFVKPLDLGFNAVDSFLFLVFHVRPCLFVGLCTLWF